jgi:hypothetical protein
VRLTELAAQPHDILSAGAPIMSQARITFADALRVLNAVAGDLREPDANRHAAARAYDMLLDVGRPAGWRPSSPAGDEAEQAMRSPSPLTP